MKTETCDHCGQFLGQYGHECSTRETVPAFQRFMAKHVAPSDQKKCWLWTGAKDPCGYGKMMIGSRTNNSRRLISAHRYSYLFYIGPIEEGMFVLHRCNTRNCVNPNHLYLGTQRETVMKTVRRGRWTQGFKKMVAV